jgi:chemotaxis protein methyltransferase CheR
MLLPDLKEWRIEILGTDINEEFLKKAERGVYSEWSFRMLDKDIQRKYFKDHPDGWEIHERFRKMVKFQYGNLLEEGFYSQYHEICGMDIIMCRNVFIYFKPETVSSVLKNITRMLNIEGYLITGHGELHGLDLSSLRQLISAEGVIYKKLSGLIEQTPVISKTSVRINESSNFDIKRKAVHKSKLSDPEAKSITRNIKAEIEELISRGKYAEAIDTSSIFMIDNKERYCILHTISQAYADLGDYERAEVCCRKAINIDAASADPYFLLAQIAEARGNDEEAIELLNKAIYLNPSFIAAYCELGALYERHNNSNRAKKFRNTAAELLMSQNPGMPVKPYDITSGELLASIRELINS